jgi:uncharacterized membrane protein HdeD (DUF308 family)
MRSDAGSAPGPARDEEDFPLKALARASWQFLMLAGFSAVVLGLIALFWPTGTLIVAGVLFGIYLLVSGIAQVVEAFGEHVPTSMRVLSVIVGVLSIALGLFCFRGALESVLLLSLWIGIGFLLRGITVTVAAGSAPSVPGRGWAIILGLLTVLAGVIMISWPIGSIATLTILVGWWLLFIGIAEIVHAFQLRSAVRSL